MSTGMTIPILAGYITAIYPNLGNEEYIESTGLLDKNGKEIYEGDIVCMVDDVVVENIGGYDRTEPQGSFYEVAYGFGKEPNTVATFYLKGTEMFLHGNEDMEVIGNIYENPELIK